MSFPDFGWQIEGIFVVAGDVTMAGTGGVVSMFQCFS